MKPDLELLIIGLLIGVSCVKWSYGEVSTKKRTLVQLFLWLMLLAQSVGLFYFKAEPLMTEALIQLVIAYSTLLMLNGYSFLKE